MKELNTQVVRVSEDNVQMANKHEKSSTSITIEEIEIKQH